MTIYVPATLRKRMRRHDKDENWSALACRAFELRLAELARERKVETMKDVIERLRGTKVEAGSESFQAGFSRGQEWARTKATAAQLDRLAAVQRQWVPTGEWHMLFGGPKFGLFAPFEWVYFFIEPADRDDCDTARDFWQCLFVEDHDRDEPEYVRGFVEGAIGVWAQVRDEV